VRHHAGRDIMRQRRVTFLGLHTSILGQHSYLFCRMASDGYQPYRSKFLPGFMFPITACKDIRQVCTAVSTAITWECEILGLSGRVDDMFALLGCFAVRIAH
jgi:hypothetical protein